MMIEEVPELHRDPDAAAEMAVNSVLKYLHECDLVGEEAKRNWLQKVYERIKAKELSH